jgi:methyl-accepting chemotaxis protein
MSEFEVRKARLGVEKSAAEFEQALDKLLTQVEEGAEKISHITDRTKDFTARVRDFVDVDKVVHEVQEEVGSLVESSVEQAREAGTRIIGDLREIAEEQLKKMDKRPLVSWTAVLISGFALGYALAKKKAA